MRSLLVRWTASGTRETWSRHLAAMLAEPPRAATGARTTPEHPRARLPHRERATDDGRRPSSPATPHKGDPMAAEPTGTPVLDLITSMTAASMEASNLDPETLMLVRIAALVAEGAPTASYLMNLGAAAEVGVDIDQVQGVLAAVAPIVGTTHIVDATGRIAEALGIALVSSE